MLWIFSARRELCPVLYSDAIINLRTMAFSMISATVAPLTSSPTTFSTGASFIARSEEATKALTTPYVYPAECDPVWNLTSQVHIEMQSLRKRSSFKIIAPQLICPANPQASLFRITLTHVTMNRFTRELYVLKDGWRITLV